MFRVKLKENNKDLERRDPDKSRIAIFFELLSTKFWDLCKVNLLYIVTSIPAFLVLAVLMGMFSSKITDAIINPYVAVQSSGIADAQLSMTIIKFDAFLRSTFALWFVAILGSGPSTAGITYILRNYSREEHAFLLSDWWGHTRSNFKQALIVWIVDIFAVFMFTIAFIFYWSQGGAASFLAIVIAYLAVTYLLLRLYLYQIMITFSCSLKQLYKNGLTLAMQNLPQSILMLAISLFIHIGIPCIALIKNWAIIFWGIYFVIEIIFMPALVSFMTNFFIYPKFEECINENIIKKGEN